MLPLTEVDENTAQLLEQLRQKMDSDGQNLSCHLEGLVHCRYTTYWDYLNLDVLLHLQRPRTQSPDELIFITYHQITELYFKLILAEIEQVTGRPQVDAAFFAERIDRVNRYLQNLVHSFEVMVSGLDKEQFLRFRTALAPASGFQSHQFRVIEILSTSLSNLRAPRFRQEPPAADAYEQIYWKQGAMANDTGKKDMSLVLFEQRYDPLLRQQAGQVEHCHLEAQLARVSEEDPAWTSLKTQLRTMDQLVNIDWRLAHLRSASRHLRVQQSDVKATGGTNWRKYLPPRFQKLMFFPGLWSEEEQAEWGRSHVEELFQ